MRDRGERIINMGLCEYILNSMTCSGRNAG